MGWVETTSTTIIISGRVLLYRKACGETSRSTCPDRSLSQCDWFPAQHWPGWMWLARRRSPSACWGKGQGYLCQAHIQSSYWTLTDKILKKKWHNLLKAYFSAQKRNLFCFNISLLPCQLGLQVGLTLILTRTSSEARFFPQSYAVTVSLYMRSLP